jgi:uncharacterized protein YbjT (DUF2867 family)
MNDTATINYQHDVVGELINQHEWFDLTADQLREAIGNGDLVLIKRPDGQYQAICARFYADAIDHRADYFRPAWAR